MSTEAHKDTRPATIRYTIYSLELAPCCPGLPEGSDEDWSDELETTLRDFAERYGVALTEALAAHYPDRRVRVDVVHATTGGSTCTEPEDVEYVQEIAGRLLERLSEAVAGGAK